MRGCVHGELRIWALVKLQNILRRVPSVDEGKTPYHCACHLYAVSVQTSLPVCACLECRWCRSTTTRSSGSWRW